MEATKIKEVLELHRKWLADKRGGSQADLFRADLSGADLTGGLPATGGF